MIKFTKDFNSCKTVSCKNFGIPNSETYIQKSERLGYLSTECTLCGSNPPWINNHLIKEVLAEKQEAQFGQKIIGCQKCRPYFFMPLAPKAKRHGFTSAGTQRKKCNQCASVFTLPEYKNREALKAVLVSVLSKGELSKDTLTSSIKESGLSSRLYYFYLNKLALIFSNFSRLQEQPVITRKYMGMHSEGRVISLNHQRGLYNLFTAEVESGYILLQTNNLTHQEIGKDFIYNETESTVATNIASNDLEAILLARYHSNLKRNHFEQLIMGKLKPIANCTAIYPDKVAYLHFQLLTYFTNNIEQYDHYIEHESTLRSAALISSLADINNKKADIYFLLPFENSNESLTGKRFGWWNDIWFSQEKGAICPITSKSNEMPNLNTIKCDAIEDFYRFLNKQLNKNSNSMQVLDNLSEIYRVIYNYCEPQKEKTSAMLLGISDRIYQPEQLLDEALERLQAD
ncbi:hypothetical protein GCM10007916_28540 [Psychromonas marina]|uniref:IS1 family transposase n=1 Tax=Psychromonas marina TaxID=88364 RepID=A0ABQ6E2Y9_9GAMM|nr:hypothetical protein [Psychromonas marina]GLS91784.1 hypothetical protein GCM10007916_28540 [Psychromonas marina]